MAGESQTPAGWYADPQNPDQQRYWDGLAWAAEGVAPAPDRAPYAGEGQSTNGFAIVSLVSGILWIGGLASLLALVFGRIAKEQIAESNGREGGGRMASVGVILGWVGIGITIIAFGLLVLTVMYAMKEFE